MMFFLIALTALVVALLRVVHDDRPRSAPRSHFCEAVTAHDRWERV